MEAAETIAEAVEAITCRWCGRSDAIEVVARADAGGEDLSRG